MGRTHTFLNELEKNGANWWAMMKKPFQMYGAAARSPKHRIKRALGLGAIGTAGAIYGVDKLSSNPEDQMTDYAPGLGQ